GRFYKITPSQDWPRQLDNPFWFVSHRRLGYVVGILTIVALAFGLWGKGGVDPVAEPPRHRGLGLGCPDMFPDWRFVVAGHPWWADRPVYPSTAPSGE